MTTTSTRRTTGWTFVCYPDSMPEDWEERLRSLHVPLAYILHDRDKAHGVKVKPHVHVLVKYDSVKALDQVRQDFDFTGIRYMEQVRSFNTMTCYLCHLDDEDKAQYKPEDVIAVSGLSLDFSRHLSPDEQLDALQELFSFIEDNDIRDYSMMVNIAINEGQRIWLSLLTGKYAPSVTHYLKSRSYREI